LNPPVTCSTATTNPQNYGDPDLTEPAQSHPIVIL